MYYLLKHMMYQLNSLILLKEMSGKVTDKYDIEKSWKYKN